MRRLPTSPHPPTRYTCIHCIRRRHPSLPYRRQSAFLALPSTASSSSLKASDVLTKRNLSQFAGVEAGFAAPAWNALIPPTPSADTSLPPSLRGLNQDVLDKMFERTPLWQTTEHQRLISPTIDSGDPDGIQKYLIQGSSIPKNTVELLTVLDALVAQDDLARAATVVASLKRHLDPNTPLSTLVYNKYLEGVVSSTIQNSGGVGRAMEWFQEMMDNGVKADRTTFALLSKAALSLTSVTDGNRAARKVFGIWRSQGGDVGDLLCDLAFPQEEILRSLKVELPRNLC